MPGPNLQLTPEKKYARGTTPIPLLGHTHTLAAQPLGTWIRGAGIKKCSKNLLACCFCLPFYAAQCFLFLAREGESKCSFFAFCFGPTPFGKLMRKFFVKCENFAFYFLCFIFGAVVCLCVCKLATGQRAVCLSLTVPVPSLCPFSQFLHISRLSTCLCPLDWWLLCALVQPGTTSGPPKPQPPGPLPWLAFNFGLRV